MEGFGGTKGRNDTISKPKKNDQNYFYMYMCSDNIYAYASCVCLGPKGARRRCQIIWKLSYRGL